MFINCLYKIDNCRYIRYRYFWDGGARSLDKPAPITARKFSHGGGNTRAERNEHRRPSGIFVRLIAAARIVSGRQVGRNRNDTFSGKTTTEFKAAAATTRGVNWAQGAASCGGGVCLRAVSFAAAVLQMLQVAVISNTCFDRINKSSCVRRVNNNNNNISRATSRALHCFH